MNSHFSSLMFEKALGYALQIGDIGERIFAICNIAEALIQVHMDKKAMQLLLLALDLSQKLGNYSKCI